MYPPRVRWLCFRHYMSSCTFSFLKPTLEKCNFCSSRSNSELHFTLSLFITDPNLLVPSCNAWKNWLFKELSITSSSRHATAFLVPLYSFISKSCLMRTLPMKLEWCHPNQQTTWPKQNKHHTVHELGANTLCNSEDGIYHLAVEKSEGHIQFLSLPQSRIIG